MAESFQYIAAMYGNEALTAFLLNIQEMSAKRALDYSKKYFTPLLELFTPLGKEQLKKDIRQFIKEKGTSK